MRILTLISVYEQLVWVGLKINNMAAGYHHINKSSSSQFTIISQSSATIISQLESVALMKEKGVKGESIEGTAA